MKSLKQTLDELTEGKFGARARLADLMLEGVVDGDASLSVPMALIARHQDVSVFEEAFSRVDDLDCVRTLVVSLGLTGSPKAIPLILNTIGEFDAPELRGYAHLALESLFPLSGLDEDSVDTRKLLSAYASVVPDLEAEGGYFYRGAPLFVGDLCKELVTAAVAAFEQGTPLILIHQAEVLTAESGLECPVQYGQEVTADMLQGVYSYVKQLSGLSWVRGQKRYWGHIVG